FLFAFNAHSMILLDIFQPRRFEASAWPGTRTARRRAARPRPMLLVKRRPSACKEEEGTPQDRPIAVVKKKRIENEERGQRQALEREEYVRLK
ncbi:hypothetical protein PFISCL1PPCAC_5400, partial [Pristionchus fissidentatus]